MLSKPPPISNLAFVTDAAKDVDKISQIINTKGEVPKEQSIINDILEKQVPFYDKLASSGTAMAKILSKEIPGAIKTHAGPAGIAFSGVDLVRIPLVFALSWILTGKRPPIELPKATQWGLAAVGVTLGVLAITFPPAAMFIAIAASGVSFLAGGAFFVKMIKDRMDVKKELLEINKTLCPLMEIKSKITQLDNELKEIEKNKDNPDYAQKRANVCNQINEKYKEFIEFKNQVPNYQELLNKKVFLEKKMEQMGPWSMADKAVAVVAPALTALFLGASIVFPPLVIGAAVVAGAGALYAVSRFVAPRIAPPILSAFKRFGSWIKGKLNSPSNKNPQPKITPVADPSTAPLHTETAQELKELPKAKLESKSREKDVLEDFEKTKPLVLNSLLHPNVSSVPQEVIIKELIARQEEKKLRVEDNQDKLKSVSDEIENKNNLRPEE